MQNLVQPSAKEVDSARKQNKLLRDTLARLKAHRTAKTHTGNLQEDLRSILDLVTEERMLMERLESELYTKQMRYEQLLSDTVASVKSSLHASKGPFSASALLLERENAEIAEWRRKIAAEVKTAAETLNQLKVTEIEQDAELSLQTMETGSFRAKVPTLHKSGARLNENHRSPILKPIDSRRG